MLTKVKAVAGTRTAGRLLDSTFASKAALVLITFGDPQLGLSGPLSDHFATQ